MREAQKRAQEANSRMEISLSLLPAEDLHSVDALMKQNSATLGFLPFEALTDYQQRGGLLGAKTENNELAGYLLYATPHSYFRIAQLCVSEHHRGKNIARTLLNHLCASATTQRLIKLHCRRDYPVNSMWPKLGFVPLRDKPGRSSAGHSLTYWCLTLAQDHQLELFQAQTLDEHINVVVDAQVFFDFHEPASNKTSPSQALRSDFPVDTLRLWATDELLVEIDRNRNQHQRETSRRRALEFSQIRHEPALANRFEALLRKILPSNSRSQLSDIRHLAKTAASNASMFVTRDKSLLSQAEQIRDLIDLTVLSPTELIVRFSELYQERRGSLDRVSGSDVSWRNVVVQDIAPFPIDTFVDPDERHGPFLEKLNAFLAQPDSYECKFLDMGDNIVALRVLSNHERNCLSIPLARTSRVVDRSRVERFLISDTLSAAIAMNCDTVSFDTTGVGGSMISSLVHMGFIEHKDAHVRFTIPSSMSREQALARIASSMPDLMPKFRSMTDIDLQRHCSPLSIPSSQPAFLFPIRPVYAMSLFDLQEARQDLFGANTSVLFRSENVYYRKATHRQLIEAPARILWYVSNPTKSITAISQLDAVEIDQPKNLFRAFEKFGILGWQEIYDMCEGNVDQELMAIQFSNTFLLRNPMSLEQLRDIFNEHGRQPVLQSPSQICAPILETIIQRGFEERS